jgi:uncharacterized YccA/Bax inhibitor family protein
MSNPVIERAVGEYAVAFPESIDQRFRKLTLDSVIQKTIYAALVLAFGVAAGWIYAPNLSTGAVILLAISGLALGVFNSFRKQVTPLGALSYAVVQGLFVGVISFNLDSQYPGIARQAFLGASVTFVTILFLYAAKIVRSGPRFLKVLQYSIISYAVFALISFGTAIFGLNDGWGLYGGSMGLLFAGLGVVLATLSLVADFGAIDQAVAMGAGEDQAWRLAFGLTVTYVWLYIELLRLLALLARSND